jgi:hypothetical protein
MAQKSKKTSSNKMKLSSFSAGELFIYVAAFSMSGLFTLWVSFAAPHSGSGGKGGGTSTISGPAMINDLNSDGLANWGDHITFNVTTLATYPYVNLTCYSNGAAVLTQTAGFWPDYVWGQTYALENGTWTSGAADCTAVLYSQSSKKPQTLATLNFHVNP